MPKVTILDVFTLLQEQEMAKKHIGFEKAEKSIMKKEGMSKESAGAVLASGARKASKSAKEKNPALCKVKMKKKH